MRHRPEPARSKMTLGCSAPGAAVAFLGDVLGNLQMRGKQRLIVHGGEAVVAAHGLGEGAGDGLLNRVGDLLETLQGIGRTCRGRLGRAAQPIMPKPIE